MDVVTQFKYQVNSVLHSVVVVHNKNFIFTEAKVVGFVTVIFVFPNMQELTVEGDFKCR